MKPHIKPVEPFFHSVYGNSSWPYDGFHENYLFIAAIQTRSDNLWLIPNISPEEKIFVWTDSNRLWLF